MGRCNTKASRHLPVDAVDGYIFRFHGEDYDLQALHSEVEKIAQLFDGRE